MRNFLIRKNFAAYLALASFYLVFTPARLLAQIEEEVAESEDYTWWYLTLAVLAVALGGAIWWVIKSRKQEKQRVEQNNIAAKKRSESLDFNSLDVDKELEWLRKNQKVISRKRKSNLPKKESPQFAASSEELDGDTVEIKLPIFDFERVEPAARFDQLPLSDDEALISAVEQTYDEDEEDESVRELSLRILNAFKTRNSVEALSQMALYDLSSSLRSQSVGILTEFDHESVFETILLACADPSREVRAAAARGLTRLSFDRADAWARILQSCEGGRIKQAAHAATESGFVGRAFERLVHPDRQQAYEAFVLLTLLVAAGETDELFAVLKNHKDQKVKLAVLHLLKVSKNQNALDGLYGLLEDKSVPAEVRAEADKVIEEIGLVAV